jgi:hypothetical protein
MEAALKKGEELVQTKIKGECGHEHHLVGYRPKKLLTMLGEVEYKRAYYQCQLEQEPEEGAQKDQA